MSARDNLKILMVTREVRADRLYGLGRSLQPLVEEFGRRGIEVRYLCRDDLGPRALLWQRRLQRLLQSLLPAQDRDTDFATLVHVLLERLNMGRLAAKLALREGYTHVHCHDPIIAAGLRLLLRLRPGHLLHWGVTEHGFGCYMQAIHDDGVRIGPRLMRRLRAWEARTLTAAAWVIAPTRSCIEQTARELCLSAIPPNWHHVYHARPDLSHYEKTEARSRLGWRDEDFYVLGVGRIAPVKQFPLLVEACARLHTQKTVRLIILGEGDREGLQALARQAGLSHDILFATTEDIGLYLHAVDLYVSTSRSESFGLANLEAMAAGTPAICSAVGGVPEVVGDAAVLVAPELDALADAMQRLLEDDNLRSAVARKERDRAATWPDIEEVANDYEQIYRRAMASEDSRVGAMSATGPARPH